jgi:hypothetical protein
MPNITSSTDLRNTYNKMLNSKLELYRLLDEGREAVKKNRKRSFKDAIQDIRQEIIEGRL